jgi:CheY-like chemotaxis protein
MTQRHILMKDLQKTILIVEDSPVQVLAVLKLLENRGVTILCASNGEAGVEMARQILPDLVLLDIEMPGMNGLEVCRLLRDDTRTAKIPIILLTTHTDLETVRAGFVGGAVDFIPKDAFYETVLVETLRQMKFFEPELAAPHSLSAQV